MASHRNIRDNVDWTGWPHYLYEDEDFQEISLDKFFRLLYTFLIFMMKQKGNGELVG